MPTELKQNYNPRLTDLHAEWHVVDAEGQVLGRMASDIAVKLMGKHRPEYVPHLLSGDFVIVVNASKVRVTGKKAGQKKYRRHSGYPGNLKEIPYSRMMERTPARIIEHAVRGMLPKNKLGRKALRRLKVYAGPEHPHEAQVIGSERSTAKLETTPDLDDIEVVAEDQSIVAVPPPPKPIDQTPPPPAEEETADMSTVEETAEAEAAVDTGTADSDAPAASQDDIALSDLGLDDRILAALESEGWSNVSDVLNKSNSELLAAKGFGARSLEKLDDALQQAGHKRG